MALLWLPALPGVAPANPMPEAAVFVHVQPPAPGSPPLSDCAQLVQYTSASGELQFDLYLKCFVCEPGYPLSSLTLELEWDGDWTWLGYELPAGAEGSVSAVGNRASVSLAWPECPPSSGEVLHLLRCFLSVTGPGRLGSTGEPGEALVGCPPETMPLFLWIESAQAGVDCAYCWTDCNYGAVCTPATATPLLTLAVPQGTLISESVDFTAYGGAWPCPFQAIGSEPWMQVTTETLGEPGSYRATLSVDTGLLEPGHYGGWLRGESECVACTRVELEVLLPTGVGSLPGISWGRIKALY